MNLGCLSFAAGLLLAAAPALAQPFTIAQPTGTDTFGARSVGQTFTPNVGVAPDPGNPGILQLTEVTFYRGNGTANLPSATTFLHIYDGDPLLGGTFVGCSTNSIDTTVGAFHAPFVWTFPQLVLLYTNKHWAVMASSSTPGALPSVEVPLETAPRSGPNVYTGGAGLIANVVEHPSSVDARFLFRFYNGLIPTYATFASGCAGPNGVPTNSSPSLAQIGGNLVVQIGNVPTPEAALLYLGLSNTNSAFGPLPIDLGILGAGGCLARVSTEFELLGLGAANTVSFTQPVPNNGAFLGVSFYTQAYALAPGWNGLGAVASDAAAGTIGN